VGIQNNFEMHHLQGAVVTLIWVLHLSGCLNIDKKQTITKKPSGTLSDC